MSVVSTRFTAALSNLKSRDDRKRRRAVRELFEMDDENNLSAFIPLLSDKDSWYRSKALDAFRMWSMRKSVDSLEPLISHQNLDYNRAAANLLEKFRAEDTEVVKQLFAKDDIICKTKSAEFLLKSDGEEIFFEELLKDPDSRLRIIALESKYCSAEIHEQFLNDQSVKVVEYCLGELAAVNFAIEDRLLGDMLDRGIKLGLIIPYIVENNPQKLTNYLEGISNQETKILVDLLQQKCQTLDDEPIKTLIKECRYIIVGRWLQGRRGELEDELRWQIIADETVDEIERSRFLERLFSRCDEANIRRMAEKISETSSSELIRLTAHNLSTAEDKVKT